MDGLTVGWNERRDGWMVGCMDGWPNGRTDGHMDERTNGQTDG
jgi:hypothetical protein